MLLICRRLSCTQRARVQRQVRSEAERSKNDLLPGLFDLLLHYDAVVVEKSRATFVRVQEARVPVLNYLPDSELRLEPSDASGCTDSSVLHSISQLAP